MGDGKQMGMEWLREAWRQTQLCTHRRKTAPQIRQGQEKVPGVHRNRAPRRAGAGEQRAARARQDKCPGAAREGSEPWALLPDTEEGEKWELSRGDFLGRVPSWESLLSLAAGGRTEGRASACLLPVRLS